MQMKLLALWPLLLIQMPTVFMSDASPSEDGVIKLAKRKRDDRSSGSLPESKRVAGSSHEQPEERIQAQPNWVPFTTSEKERGDMLCKKLEETLRKWRLSLPTEEDLDPTKPLCGLRLDPQTTVAADADEIAKGAYKVEDIKPTWIRKSEMGNILILPYKGSTAQVVFSAKGRRYVLHGGIAKIRQRRDRLAYIDFTANTGGISAVGFKHVEFETTQEYNHAYRDWMIVRLLPKSIPSLEDNSVYLLSLKYLFYKDVGPLEAPYPIPHLGLSNQLLTDEEVAQALQLEWVDWRTIGYAIGLIRLVQLWKELNPDHEFKHLGLKKLNEQLEALSDDATESEKKELLLAACDLVIQRNADGNDAGNVIRGENGHVDYPFLRVLMEKERKVGESFAIELDDDLVPKKPIDEAIGNELFDKLAFYHSVRPQGKKIPYEIKITCQGQHFTFRLIANISQYGTLTTYGTDYDPEQGVHIFKEAEYSHKPSLNIIYFLDKKAEKPQRGLVIYQCVSDDKRTKGTKVASH